MAEGLVVMAEKTSHSWKWTMHPALLRIPHITYISQPVTIFQMRVMTIGHTVHWIRPVTRSSMCPPAIKFLMLKILQKFVEKTCCMLLVEHRGGQGEEVVVVGGREGGVHVDDIVWW